MNRRTRFLISSLLLLAALVGVPVLLTWRTVKQEGLDRALIAAVKKRQVAAVVSLLKQGADPNAREHVGRPISFRQRFTQLFGRMLGRHYDPPTKGDSALLLATNADEVQPAIVIALLDNGANVEAKDGYGDTALLALFEGRLMPHTRSILIIPPENALLVEALVNRGVDINARDSSGETALMIAAGHGWTKTVTLLLEKKADVNAVAPDSNPGTALANAALLGHTSIVRLLKQAGAKE